MISALYRLRAPATWFCLSCALAAVSQTTNATSSAKAFAPVSTHDRNAAERAFLSGAKALEAGKYPAAEALFARAEALDPARKEYLQALLLARQHHVSDLLHAAASVRTAEPARSEALLSEARALDPLNSAVAQHAASPVLEPFRTSRTVDPLVLLHNASSHSYHERSDLRMLAEHVARDYGVRAVLDPDLRTQQFRLDVDDATFDEAMRALNLLTATMFVPLDEHTVLLAQDTAANHQRYDRLVEQTFYLPGIPADQMKDFVTIAQNVLNIQKVSVDSAQNAVIVRGPADLADAANAVFMDLLNGSNEVLFDIKVYAVDHQQTRNLGVVLPSSFTAYNLAAQAQSILSANSSLVQQLISSGVIPAGTSDVAVAAYLVFVAGISSGSNLTNTFAVFGGGSTTTGVTTSNVPTLNLALSRSDARTLDDVQLRAGDRQNAIFKAGLRYPIQTSLFSNIASTATNQTINGVSLSSLLSQYLGTNSLTSGGVIPQVQYEDLGLTVTANPKIQRNGDVSLHLEVKITALAGGSLNGIPVLANRQFSSDLTTHDGDTVMMVSATSKSETAAITGLPGLSEIPGFQSTTNRNGTQATSDLVLLVTPHIVRLTHPTAKGPYIELRPRPDTD